jgi:hypothetical protein
VVLRPRALYATASSVDGRKREKKQGCCRGPSIWTAAWSKATAEKRKEKKNKETRSQTKRGKDKMTRFQLRS